MYDRKNDPVRGSARNLFAAWCGRTRIRWPLMRALVQALLKSHTWTACTTSDRAGSMAAAPQPEATGRGAWQVPRRRS